MEQRAALFLVGIACHWLHGAHAQSVSDVVLKMIKEERVILEAPPDDYSDKSEFDFIVVGAGAAGCAVASRLSEVHEWTVLLLEAGEDETFTQDIPLFARAAEPSMDWGYKLKEMPAGCPLGPEGRCPYPLGKVLGGSTVSNYMVYNRGNPDVYNNWAEMGNGGWSYNDTLQYFKKAENVTIDELRDSPYHGTEGPIRVSYIPYTTPLTDIVLAAAKEKGIPEVDYNGAQPNGVSRMQTTTFLGGRWTTNRGYLYPARNRSNLFVRKRSLVTDVLFEKVFKSAHGVRYERDGRPHKAFATKEVILCAGAVNTPKLLMLSGVGPREHLEDLRIPVVSDLKVGENFMDQTQFLGLAVTLNTSISPTPEEIFSNLENYISYIYNCTGPLTSPVGTEMMYLFQAGAQSYNRSSTDFELYFFHFLPTITYQYFSTDIYEDLRQRDAILPALASLQPLSRGSIKLASKNIHDQPIIDPNYFNETEDVTNAVEGIKKMIEILETDAFREFGAELYEKNLPGCETDSFGTDEYWKCVVKRYSVPFFHPCGTCRMGPKNDPRSVVTPNLLVKGVNRLRVVDASIFPHIPSGGLEAPTLMAAEKASDMIKKRYRRLIHL